MLLETFINQVAFVIERELLDEAAEQSLMLRESERLYTTLLNSISHELRTPLATITGAASMLRCPDQRRRSSARAELTQDIQTAADRLNRLVENLLDMSRLDAGRLKLKLDWCDVGEVDRRGRATVGCVPADTSIDDPCRARSALGADGFCAHGTGAVNLLDNACNYTPPGTHVSIDATLQAGRLCLVVADTGPGIPPDDLERIFDKFYRVPGTATGGTGLGLSICRGLVEAHGGTLVASNASGGGARFTIYLPATTAPPPVKEAVL